MGSNPSAPANPNRVPPNDSEAGFLFPDPSGAARFPQGSGNEKPGTEGAGLCLGCAGSLKGITHVIPHSPGELYPDGNKIVGIQLSFIPTLFIMKTVSILIAVDVEGALASGNLHKNVHLVDTNKYCGSWFEGSSELFTECKNGQAIEWRVSTVNDQNTAQIEGFTGKMVDSKVCVPQPEPAFGGRVNWAGRVDTGGKTGFYQYSITLSFEGKKMKFAPFLRVKP